MTKICKECMGKIPREATTCRHCGRTGIPVPPAHNGRRLVFWAVLIGIIALWGIFGQFGKDDPPLAEKQQASAEPELSDAEKLERDCIAHYGRMCRDEAEALIAGFRSGLNQGLRSD
jgi:hypothetical protein